MVAFEWWLCGECLHVARSDRWGIEDGNNDAAVCPGCGFAHHDDEMSWVEAGTELEMRRKALAENRNERVEESIRSPVHETPANQQVKAPSGLEPLFPSAEPKADR